MYVVTLLVVAAVFCGALTRSTFAFGEAVVGMPLLALLPISLHTAVSLMGLVGLTIAVLAIATGGWRHIDRTALVRLGVSALIGIPFGLALIRIAPVGSITTVLGAVLIVYGGYSLAEQLSVRKTMRLQLADQRWAPVFGFASGVLGSAYNFNGVPVAVYGSLRGWPPDRFRGTLQAHFLLTGVLIVAGQGLGGLWTAEVFRLYLLSIPAMALATVLGARLRQRIPVVRFRRYVLILVMALGVLMLIKAG
ncbi:MAG: sulfite exporter TauE/SafE family protein [Thermaerobacter sp.]|nr:sulfite exporter TauE/SafE family protein [Thermaerobacter sp.]